MVEFICEKNIEKTKLLIQKKDLPIFICAQDDVYNRNIIEFGKFDSIFGLDSPKRKRTLRNIDSGFNEVMAKISKKNNVKIGIDLESIRSTEKLQMAERLIQVMQNIRVAKKSFNDIRFLGVKDKRNCISLLRTLGASNSQISKSLHF